MVVSHFTAPVRRVQCHQVGIGCGDINHVLPHGQGAQVAALSTVFGKLPAVFP